MNGGWNGGRGLMAVLILLGVSALPAPPVQAGQAVEVLVENDFFGPRRGGLTDRYYSSALKASFKQSEADLSAPGRWLARTLYGSATLDRFETEAFSLAHSFFTPEELESAAEQPGDHPWSGWLRLSYDLSVRHDGIIDTTHLSVGVVGPAAQAEPLQRWWHAIINDPTPRGWDNQLKNEAVVQGSWERAWPRLPLFSVAGLEADLVPLTEVTVGNALIQASATAHMRFGQGLRMDGGGPRPGPGRPSAGVYTPRGEGLGWYVFAGATARGVGRSLFIEGNTLRDSAGLDAEHFVHDVSAGVVLETRRGRLSYSYVSRSEEFEGQRGRHRFGLVGLTVAF